MFHSSRENPEHLPYAATIGLMAAALLAGWGYFIRQNEVAERLEPEAMEAAKSEDKKIDESQKRQVNWRRRRTVDWCGRIRR